MTSLKWINETAARYGVGGDPNVYKMMAVAIAAERERCAKIADAVARGGTLALKGVSVHAGTAEAIAEAIRNKD